MANKERNKRSARQARQRERAAQVAAQEISTASVPDMAEKKSAPKKSVEVSVAKGSQQGLLARARSYFGAVRSEMHRVVWPSRAELTNYSVAVIVMLIVFGVLVWAVDTGFVELLVLFTGLRG